MNDISLTDLLRSVLDRRLVDVHVSMPGRVESFDAATMSCSAKPLVRRARVTEDDARAVESLPIINDVPVVFLGGARYGIEAPLEPGDTVLLVFSEASLDRWLQVGGEVDPGDDRMHSLSDAIAIPGLRSFSAAAGIDMPDDAVVVRAPDGGSVRLGGVGATQSIIRGDAFKVALNTVLDAIAAVTGTSAAVTTFKATWGANLSAKVRVE